MAYKEYIGCKSVEAVNYDGNGNDICSMWLTDTEIIRCRDCKHYRIGRTYVSKHVGASEPQPQCGLHRSIGYFKTDPNGFCAWAERDA